MSAQLIAYRTGSSDASPSAPFAFIHALSSIGTSRRSQTNPPALRIGWCVLRCDSSRNAAIAIAINGRSEYRRRSGPPRYNLSSSPVRHGRAHRLGRVA